MHPNLIRNEGIEIKYYLDKNKEKESFVLREIVGIGQNKVTTENIQFYGSFHSVAT
jgi:hypothetical protein